MLIHATGCLHGQYPEMPGGDLMVVTGDMTARDKHKEWIKFYEWIEENEKKYRKIIYIAGNHDGFLTQAVNSTTKRDLQRDYPEDPDFMDDFQVEYLCDSGTEFDGLKIWGSPWVPKFGGWKFMISPEERKEKWQLIPEDTQLLITHGPPLGILDKADRLFDPGYENVGCHWLRQKIEHLRFLKCHIFSHIHESYGYQVLTRPGFGDENNIRLYNVSHMDRDYEPVNPIVEIIL